ncbi:hypothetical protein TSARBOMBA_19 [Bacillus phage TsarBomba]|uniref:Uncharacterized protein n=1 Tax=Bacillus phage TsarBomba TaxID=1690456 RepID=A0A0K2D062_9CAUD|nr:hypothetical protein TSARBOMBA_19 [Bacillus phage TsarBomba]ALA13135.1 hypothetical protein TSARBOMBA_19 [Bacillus phage TsarBomba]
MGKVYTVAVPVVAKVLVEVSGVNSEQEAIEKALAVDMTLNPSCSDTTVDLEEWDTHKQVVQGNVYYGCINEPYVAAEDEE